MSSSVLLTTVATVASIILYLNHNWETLDEAVKGIAITKLLLLLSASPPKQRSSRTSTIIISITITKSDSLLLSGNGLMKILDFGLVEILFVFGPATVYWGASILLYMLVESNTYSRGNNNNRVSKQIKKKQKPIGAKGQGALLKKKYVRLQPPGIDSILLL